MLGTYKHWILASFPSDNFPDDLSCYKLEETKSVPLQEGQVRIRVTYVTVDPVSRVWISGARSYLPPIKIGDPVPSFALGRITQIKGKTFMNLGDMVFGVFTWAQQFVCPIKDAQLIPFAGDNDYEFLSIFGPTGLTAYLSYMEQFKQLDKKSNIVISSAAGGVGISLFQFLSALGYTNLYGIAGSDQKCRFVEKVGANYCVNYKTQDVSQELKKRIPGGVDLFYDNVGEEIMDAVLPVMKNHSKIVMCGATATYTKWKDKLGIKNYAMAIMKRIQFKGILYYGNNNKYASAFMEISQLGLKGVSTMVEGLDKCPQTIQGNFKGKFIGKPIIKITDWKPIEEAPSQ